MEWRKPVALVIAFAFYIIILLSSFPAKEERRLPPIKQEVAINETFRGNLSIKQPYIRTYYEKNVGEIDYQKFAAFSILGFFIIVLLGYNLFQDQIKIFKRSVLLAMRSADEEEKRVFHFDNLEASDILWISPSYRDNGKTVLVNWACHEIKCKYGRIHYGRYNIMSDYRLSVNDIPMDSTFIAGINGAVSRETAHLVLDPLIRDLVYDVEKINKQIEKSANPEALKQIVYERQKLEKERLKENEGEHNENED